MLKGFGSNTYIEMWYTKVTLGTLRSGSTSAFQDASCREYTVRMVHNFAIFLIAGASLALDSGKTFTRFSLNNEYDSTDW